MEQRNLVNKAGAGDKNHKIEDFAGVQKREKSVSEVKTFIEGLRNNDIPERDIPTALLAMGISQADIDAAMGDAPAPAKNDIRQDLTPPPQPQVQTQPQAEAPKVRPSEQKKNQQIEEMSQKINQASSKDEGTLFKVPTQTIDLPSGGHFYNGKKSVEIKFLTASEDDILFSPELIQNNKAIDALLEAVVLDPDLRPSDMLTGDRNFLIMNVRRTGFGDMYETSPMICRNCGHVHTPEVDLSKLEAKPLQYLPDDDGWYSVEMPTMKINIRFRFMTGKDEDRLQRKVNSSARKVGNTRVPAILTEKYLLQIMEVDGVKDKVYIKKFIEAMPMIDSNFFREYVSRIEPGIDLKYPFQCPSCNYVDEKDVPIGPKLFYPNADF